MTIQWFSIRTEQGRGWDLLMDQAKEGFKKLQNTPTGLAEAANLPVVSAAIDFRASMVAAAHYTCDREELFLTNVVDTAVDTFDFWYEVEAAYATFGNVYFQMVPAYNPVELHWLHPLIVEPLFDKQNGTITSYQIAGTSQRLDPAEVLHLRAWNSVTPLLGQSPLGRALGAVNIERLSVAALVAYWERGGRQLGFITTEQPLTDADMEKAKTWWRKIFSGAQEWLRVGIMGNGLKWQPISFDPKELAMAAMRLEDRLDICLALGVNPELVGVRQGNYATLRETRMQNLENLIGGRLRYYQRIMNKAIPGLNLKFDERSLPGLDRLNQMHQTNGHRQAGQTDAQGQWARP